MSVSLPQHAAALGLVTADILLRAIRTRCLLPVPFFRTLAINTCGDALAAVTPGRVGGDPIRYVGFRRLGAPGPSILALFGLEIAADAVVLFGVGALLAIVFKPAMEELLAASGRLVRTSGFWLVLAATIALAAGSVVLTRRWMPRALASLAVSLREAWRWARAQTAGILVLTTVLTLLSLVARGAILPVLLANSGGLSAGTVILGSAVLVYGQLLAPTPAGIGAVELGAVVSLAGHFPLGDLPALLLIWRGYTLVLGAVVGAVLLVREGLARRLITAVRGTNDSG